MKNGVVEKKIIKKYDPADGFSEKVMQAKASLGEVLLAYNKERYKGFAPLYMDIENYAMKNGHFYTAIALPLVRGIMSQSAEQFGRSEAEKQRYGAYFRHCLLVAQMIIDLELELKQEEEDLVLAAAICHILPENHTSVTFQNEKEELTAHFGLAPEIAEIVSLVTRKDGMSEAQQKVFYENIQKNKLALVLRLADRGNLVERLYGISSWSAHEYIYETRAFFFPMCIYAKEHYPEISGQVSVLMEKMRCHVEVSEILLSRYEAREQQLSQEILTLKEENSRIRGIIKKLQSQE